MNCVQEMKHCCWCVLLFFSHAFEFHFLNKGQQANREAAGSSCRGRCLHQALKSCVCWWFLFGAQDWSCSWGPSLSHSFEETLRKTKFSFSFEVSLAAFYGMGAFSQAFVSSAPLVATAGARLAHVHSPTKSASLQEPGLGDPAGLNA